MENNFAFMEEINKFYDVWQNLNYVYEEWAKAHDLSSNTLLVLCSLHDNQKDCTQKKISQQWLIPKQTVNMIFKDLERRGFVDLLPMSEDKRNKVIRLTETGKEYADTIVSKLREKEVFIAKEIGIERMQQLNEIMALYVELLGREEEIQK